MTDPQTIIEQYREADDENRLYLYLQYRALRNQFVQIEYESYRARLQEASDSDNKRKKGSASSSFRTGFAFTKT